MRLKARQCIYDHPGFLLLLQLYGTRTTGEILKIMRRSR